MLHTQHSLAEATYRAVYSVPANPYIGVACIKVLKFKYVYIHVHTYIYTHSFLYFTMKNTTQSKIHTPTLKLKLNLKGKQQIFHIVTTSDVAR